MPLAVGAEGEGGGEVWCLDVRAQSQREAGSKMQKQEDVTGLGLWLLKAWVKFDHQDFK